MSHENPTELSGGPWRARGIVLLAVVLRLVFFTGYHGFDDVYYIRRAYALSQGAFSLPVNHWEARIGLVGPTALAYRVFGVTTWSTVLFPFLCSLLGVVAAHWIGRRLFNDRVGLIAALLVAYFPMDVIFASMLFPTAPVTLLCGLGFGLFLLAEKEKRPAYHLASGAAFGLACVVHEAAIIALVFYPVYSVAVGRPRRAHLLGLAGLVAGLLIDPLAHGLMGNPFARLVALEHAGTAQGSAADVAYRGFNATWIAEPLIRLFAERTFGLLPLLVAPLAIYRAVRVVPASGTRDRALALMLIAVFVWTEYGTMSPRTYAPLSRLPRYLCPLTIPAMWLLARQLGDLVSTRTRRLTLAILAVSSLGCLLLDSGNRLRPYELLRATLGTARPQTVVVESGDKFPLLFAEEMHPPYALLTDKSVVPAQAVIVTSRQETRSRLEQIPGVERLADITRPQTAYEKLLRLPLVLAILRAVRPPDRFREYLDKIAPWTLTVYRMP